MSNKKTIITVSILSLITIFTITGTLLMRNPSKNLIASNKIVNFGHYESFADYELFANLDSISNKARVVVIGKVVEVNKPQEIKIGESFSPEKNESVDVTDVYTVSDIKVEKVIKGDVKHGDIVSVKQRGGLYNGKNYTEKGAEYLVEGDRNVFFLEVYDKVPASLMNPTQGKLKIKDNKILFEDKFESKINDMTEDEFLLKLKKS